MKRIEDPKKVIKRFSSENTVLTALYDHWIGDIIEEIPIEADATCDNCIMLRKSEDDTGYYFNPATKCCTYHPTLPNYLVGGILADADQNASRGKQRVEQIIDARKDVLPLGLVAPSTSEKEGPFEMMESFGLDEDRLCPYYHDDRSSRSAGLCTIWKYRNSVCATWYCKHTKGIKSYRFWRLLKNLLNHVEDKLSMWCALELDLVEQACLFLIPSLYAAFTMTSGKDTPPGPAKIRGDYKHAWGNWNGKEREFYIECARLVEGLTWAEVKDRIGADVRIYENAVQLAHRQLFKAELPYAVKPSELVVDRIDSNFIGLKTYSAFDPVDLPARIFNVLHHFDGVPLHEAVKKIQQLENVALTHDDINLLLDFEILTPVDTSEMPDEGGVK